jgi:hypothetical protein
LTVSPFFSVKKFGKKEKFSPRFVGPFEVLERIGTMAYRISLPLELSSIHHVFHLSMLRKYIPDPSHVVEYESLKIGGDLSYQEQPVQILDRREQVLHSKMIPLVKVLWRNHLHEEAT